jgi:nitroimidazol reductase NimA-like FMN-containing flavoprotein (pyridoxamine 5'-phosphate oxidase superfamily)
VLLAPGRVFATILDGMGVLPRDVEELLDAALVAELTVLDKRGEPISYPLIPLYDGEKIFMTSSILFSRKLEHIKGNPRVSVSITDPVAAQVEPFRRATIQGDAIIVEDDLHAGWERLLPLWTKKEPIIGDLVKKRFAMPLFWERSVIEITPRRVLLWAGGETTSAPDVFTVRQAA